MFRSHRLLILPFLLLTLTSGLSGCAILSTVGDAISDAYGNTVAYFNAYYNANRTFIEAETELLEAEKVNRSKGLPSLAEAGIPAAVKQKFNVVIDKCSNILAFHSNSALVDDALFLIGKSYYYQTEYVKAERKFTELLAQYAGSDLRFESHLWLLRSMTKLNRHEEVLQQIPLFIESVKKESELVGEAYLVMGLCYEAVNDLPKALEYYEKGVDLAENPILRADGQKALADLFFRSEEYKLAATAYLKLRAVATDPYVEYYALLQTSKSYRLLGNYDASFQLIDDLLDDFRFNQYMDVILLERARVLVARGDYQDAVAEYMHVDTTYSRTEAGARAAYERAQLLEEQVGDYSSAWVAYARAGVGTIAEVSINGRRKSNAFNKYFESRKEIAKLDSLIGVVTDRSNEIDSVDAKSNSYVLDTDSLSKLRAKVYYTLGELFYSELSHIDSSLSYYHQAIDVYQDSAVTPRAFFVLADIARIAPEKSSKNPEQWYRLLAGQYPNSSYGIEARRILGEVVVTSQKDPAADMYRDAERKVENARYKEAIQDLRRLNNRYPTSSFAAKSLYTTGWIYENRLLQPDSALAYYKALIDLYGNSLYASAVKLKVTVQEVPVSPDTVRTKPDSTLQQPAPVVREDLEKPVLKLPATGQTTSRRKE